MNSTELRELKDDIKDSLVEGDQASLEEFVNKFRNEVISGVYDDINKFGFYSVNELKGLVRELGVEKEFKEALKDFLAEKK